LKGCRSANAARAAIRIMTDYGTGAGQPRALLVAACRRKLDIRQAPDQVR
jgi:hypothetical protein